MIRCKNLIKNVSKYILNYNDIYYLSDNIIFKNGKVIHRLEQGFFGTFYINSNKVIIQSNYGYLFIEGQNYNGYYNYLTEKILSYLNVDKGFVYQIIGDKEISTGLKQNFYIFNNSAFLIHSSKIEAYTLPSAEPLWEFSLEGLGTYIDYEGKEQNYEVEKILGVVNERLVVGCTGQLIIEFDIKDGKITRKWQELKGFGTTAYHGRLYNKIPESRHFQLNKEQTQLYAILGEYYVVIDLSSGEVSYVTLKKDLDKNYLKRYRYSIGYAEDQTHFYTIGEMDEKHFGTEYIPQCIVMINKQNFQIEWLYRFEEDGINTDIPQVSKNKLYQLSSSKKLYIFQKES